MGLLHNELRRTSLSIALTRALGATKGAVGIERFGETLTPTINLWERPEWAVLRDEWLCAFLRGQAAGAAGTFAAVALVNPANSGLLVVLTALASNVAVAADSITLEIATEAQLAVDLTTQTVGVVRDRRANVAGFVSRAHVRNGASTVATIGQQVSRVTGPVVEFIRFQTGLPIVLPPGHGAVAITNNDASTITVALEWYERRALPGELV